MKQMRRPRGPKPTKVEVSERQGMSLEEIARRATSPQREARRAKIILKAAAGASNQEIAEQLELQRETVRTWRERWAAAGAQLSEAEAEADQKALTAVIQTLLGDEARSGAPGHFTPEQICQIVAIACEPLEGAERPVSHWSSADVAAEAVKREIVSSISARSVARFLQSGRSETASLALLVA